MKKRIAALFLSLIMCVCLIPSVSIAAAERNTKFEEELATDLKALGLFRGVSETNFDLNREPTRVEALIMLIRVLGKENEALNGNWKHPFTDVPKWADKYVGYAFETGLTKGISETQYGSGNASAVMYLTFMLRALGYSDVDGADFTWDNPFSLSKSCGILPSCVDVENFWRADAVSVSYAALPAYLNGSTQTLYDRLIASGVFTKEQYDLYYDNSAFANLNIESEQNDSKKLSASEINQQALKYVGEIITYDKSGNSIGLGTGFIYSSDGKIITNYHVIDGAYSAEFSIGGKSYDIKSVLSYDENIDLAVLKIDGNGFEYAKISTDEIAVGSTVYAIGSSRGLTNTFSQGIVTYYDRVVEGVSHIQHDASITNGNSGGPLINEYGEVVGINTWQLKESQNLNFAVSVKEISNLEYHTSVTLSELYNADNNSPYDKLITWVKNNYNNTSDNRIEYLYRESDTYSSITYNTDTGRLNIAQMYWFDNGDNRYVSIFFDKNQSVYWYGATYTRYDSYDNVEARNETFGYINANTFDSTTPLSYYSHEGGVWTEESLLLSYQTGFVILLDWFAWCLDYNNIGLTLEDFGFNSFDAYDYNYSSGNSTDSNMNNIIQISLSDFPLYLFSNDGTGTFLGNLNTNKYDSDSIANTYGKYGNKYNTDSIFNTYGTYGGKYSNYSVFNEYATKPPKIINKNGELIGYLSANDNLAGSISYEELIVILKKYNK